MEEVRSSDAVDGRKSTDRTSRKRKLLSRRRIRPPPPPRPKMTSSLLASSLPSLLDACSRIRVPSSSESSTLESKIQTLGSIVEQYEAWSKYVFPFLAPSDALERIGRLGAGGVVREELRRVHRQLHGLSDPSGGSSGNPDPPRSPVEDRTLNDAESVVSSGFGDFSDLRAISSSSAAQGGALDQSALSSSGGFETVSSVPSHGRASSFPSEPQDLDIDENNEFDFDDEIDEAALEVLREMECDAA